MFSHETLKAIEENKELSLKLQQTIDNYRNAPKDFDEWVWLEYEEILDKQQYMRLKEAYIAGRNSK